MITIEMLTLAATVFLLVVTIWLAYATKNLLRTSQSSDQHIRILATAARLEKMRAVRNYLFEMRGLVSPIEAGLVGANSDWLQYLSRLEHLEHDDAHILDSETHNHMRQLFNTIQKLRGGLPQQGKTTDEILADIQQLAGHIDRCLSSPISTYSGAVDELYKELLKIP